MSRFDRASGVFLHVTSLPGEYGIGDLGAPAREFLEYLDRAGVTYWQICPLGPTSTDHGNSPYQSFSAFAGNPLLIDPDDLRERGWLTDDDLRPVPDFDPEAVEYGRVAEYKESLLETAFERFEDEASEEDHSDLARFREAESDWLDDYALFMALKEHFDGHGWMDWPEPVRLRDRETLTEYRERLDHAVRYREFRQYCFDSQWRDLKAAADERGIDVIGDLPIYVGLDSADVWANQDAFQLDESGQPTHVAGVPPFMGDSGQRWGNPLYDWDYLSATGHYWWVKRFERLLDLVDVTRIDHFRGFASYWSIPADADRPSDGQWVDGPGEQFFETIERSLGDLPIVVEDLGFVSDGVRHLRGRFDFPGMKVLQYADWCGDDHMYQPHTFPENSIAYTATHDTDTTVGWYRDLDGKQRNCLHEYLDTDGSEINWDLIDAAWGSDSVIAITPLQDVLGLGSEARFNVPGTAEGNWRWRYTPGDLDPEAAERLRDLTEHHGR